MFVQKGEKFRVMQSLKVLPDFTITAPSGWHCNYVFLPLCLTNIFESFQKGQKLAPVKLIIRVYNHRHYDESLNTGHSYFLPLSAIIEP